MHYFWMEGNYVLTDNYCSDSKGQIYEDIKLKKYSSPSFSLKLMLFPSIVLILDTKTAGLSLKSSLASSLCNYVNNTVEIQFFQRN